MITNLLCPLSIWWTEWSKNMFSLTMPLALVRNRIKSAYDLKDPAGLRQGDAAFADYFISATVSHRF